MAVSSVGQLTSFIIYWIFLMLVFKQTEKCLGDGVSCVADKNGAWRHCDPTAIESNATLAATLDRPFSNTTCRCHNIVIGGKGDSDCTSEMNGVPWCYIIGEGSACPDKKKSTKNNVFPESKNNSFKEVYYSYKACEGDPEPDDLGNDEFLHAITLKKEDLPVDEGGGGLYAPSPAACETECFVREKHCDAWNFIFDDDSGNEQHRCHLKGRISEVCTNQRKYEKRDRFSISGYRCGVLGPICWSTEATNHPYCDEIYEGPSKFQTAAYTTKAMSATGIFGAILQRGRYRRKIWRFVRGRWRPFHWTRG